MGSQRWKSYQGRRAGWYQSQHQQPGPLTSLLGLLLPLFLFYHQACWPGRSLCFSVYLFFSLTEEKGVGVSVRSETPGCELV